MARRIAIDFETFLISEEEGTAPRPVCLSFWNGERGDVILSKHVPKFLQSIPDDVEIIAHNLKFEFNVIMKHYPELIPWVLSRLENGNVWCTLVAEQIIELGLSKKTGKYSLADIVLRKFDIDISEDKKNPNAWRLRYHELVDVEVFDWPKEAYDYSLSDSIHAFNIRLKQQTSHLDSVRASIVLGMMSDRGFIVDKDYVNRRINELEAEMLPKKELLIESGFADYDKNGIFKKKSKVFRNHLDDNESRRNLKYTKTNEISLSRKDLNTYVDDMAIVWSEYVHLEKLLNTYYKTLESTSKLIRTEYNAVVDTCRTSSRGSSLLPALNMQNLPREGGVREALIARDGYRLASIDYGSLELLCAAQQLYNIYGRSKMMDALNTGTKPVDLHSVLGAYLMSYELSREISYDEFVLNKKEPEYKKYRQLAKPLNLGYPGGIGPRKMVSTAKDSYNVDLTESYAKSLRNKFFDIYPELGKLLKVDINQLKTGYKIKYKDGSESDEYQYVINGLKRRGCTYNAACNGILMQTLAALGTKRMLWRVFQNVAERSDITMLAFIHDELIIEVYDDSEWESRVECISYIMLDSMKELLPNVRVSVEADVGYRWTKEGMGWSKVYWRD